MSDKCDVCGRDDGWHDLRTHAWQGETQAYLLSSTLDNGSTWNVEPAPEAHAAMSEWRYVVDGSTVRFWTEYQISGSAPEAHMMSAPITVREPERKHVSDAAWEAYGSEFTHPNEMRVVIERDHRKSGTVLLTVAEHDALRAEVERLKTANEGWHQAYNKVVDKAWAYEGEIERLRKGKDDATVGNDDIRAQAKEQAAQAGREASKPIEANANTLANAGADRARLAVRLSKANELSRVVSVSLDPRLGTPQPDGEPCEPMSARRWRWLP
jgi:hypothetical protein